MPPDEIKGKPQKRIPLGFYTERLHITLPTPVIDKLRDITRAVRGTRSYVFQEMITSYHDQYHAEPKDEDPAHEDNTREDATD